MSSLKLRKEVNKDRSGHPSLEKTMSLRDFLKHLEESSRNESDYYLTTQYENNQDLDDDLDEGIVMQMIHEYCPPPLPNLLGAFPLRPVILGKLAPQQVNLWIGGSAQGSSSGLHHDFHDNLYMLTRGQKKFTIFSPADAPNLYTHGRIKKIHDNGRINYFDGEDTRSDGASRVELAQYKFDILDSTVEQFKEDGFTGGILDDAIKERDSAEAELMKALTDDPDQDQIFDDFKDFVAESKDYPEEESTDDPIIAQEEPKSFCRITVPQLHGNEIPHEFPKLSQAKRYTFELKSQEMLYLPCGWFHEVTSYSAETGKDKGHLAFNYWFHPPRGNCTFDAPYEDSYWESRWEEMHQLIVDFIGAKKSGRRLFDEDDDVSKHEEDDDTN